MSVLRENMAWPPSDLVRHKMREHSAWYSGDASVLANFYNDNKAKDFMKLNHSTSNSNTFWGRQITNGTDFFMHVPVASDIAEASAGFLFGESPLIRFSKAGDSVKIAEDQKTLDKMLVDSMFFRRLVEAAESASAIGSVFIKLAWDTDISEYPIPVVVQADDAFPEFKFGRLIKLDILAAVYTLDGSESNKVYRHVETYEKGLITNVLYEGSSDRLGAIVPLNTIEQTLGLDEAVVVPDELFAVYIPNMLPNRLNRSSPFGRSDYQGIETLMDALDEVFSCWMVDVQFARAKILLPEDYLTKDSSGNDKFNIDKSIYVKLDVDPSESPDITDVQFAIRAEQFEKTVLNILDRIITSAGYSPQSFGLNISGRAESGTALNVRERKSFSTTSKKQSYWELPIKKLVSMMVRVYNEELGGNIICDPELVNVEFCDSVSNNIGEISTAIKTLSDAKSISTDTKVRMAHPEWTDSQVEEEVAKILDEDSSQFSMENPDDNPDINQMKLEIDKEDQDKKIGEPTTGPQE